MRWSARSPGSRSAATSRRTRRGRRRGPKWGALLAAGYDAGELKEIIAALAYGRFKDEAIEDRFPMDKTLSSLRDLCIYGGKALEGRMPELLEARGTRIFKVLLRREDVEPGCR